jgi:hypothetical protein
MESVRGGLRVRTSKHVCGPATTVLVLLMGLTGSKLEKALGANVPENERYFGFENVCHPFLLLLQFNNLLM